jgi:plasmid stabilization system protein ParE
MINYSLESHPEARIDVIDAYDWYAERSQIAADAFRSELERAGEVIRRSPLMWGSYLYGTRRYLLKRFPYIIVYRVADDRIEIIAVIHGRRRPGFWKHRLKSAPPLH